MAYITRELERKFLKLNDFFKVILVTGARQVGKTYLIREFADQHYESFAEFNFIQNPDAARIFNPPSDAATMLMRMELASGQRFIPGKTLIFLDENTSMQGSRNSRQIPCG